MDLYLLSTQAYEQAKEDCPFIPSPLEDIEDDIDSLYSSDGEDAKGDESTQGSSSNDPPIYSPAVTLVQSYLNALFKDCAVSVLPPLPSPSHPSYLPLQAIQTVYEATLSHLPREGDQTVEVKYKRFDQFEKKYHSKLKFQIYYGVKVKGSKKKKATSLTQLAKRYGLPVDDKLFRAFFGAGSRNGINSEMLDGLAKSEHLLNQVLDEKTISETIAVLMKDTIADISTNLLKYIIPFLTPSSPDYASLSTLKTHIHSGGKCKKPFTALECALAAEYFVDRLSRALTHGGHDARTAVMKIKRQIMDRCNLYGIHLPSKNYSKFGRTGYDRHKPNYVRVGICSLSPLTAFGLECQ